MLPPKLTSGMPFKSSVVRCVNAIIDYLKSQRIVGDNKTIKVSQGTAGLMISAIVPPAGKSGAATATGKHYFKVVLVTDSEGTVTASVVNGFDKESEIAGYAYYNAKKVGCATDSEIELAAGYLCLCIKKGADSYTVTYSIEADIPDMPTLEDVEDDNTSKYPLAELMGSTENGWTVRQIHLSGLPELWCFGPCDTTPA